MQIFMNFLQEYGKVIDFVQFIFFFVISIMLYRKTGNVKYLEEVLPDMKYRTEHYNVTEKSDVKTGEVSTDVLRSSQNFNSLVPVYKLNKATNELEETGDFIDIQELIESHKEVALQSMLERFMPKLVDETADYVSVKGDLDLLTESIEVAEEYREKFGLSDSMSIQDIYKYMQDYESNLKSNIEKVKGGQNEKKKDIETKE